jgi:predicted AlkP superfamily phosphohydrolase/phosphomutase
MARNRLLIVFLHGGGRYYLDPLLATGRLPNIDKIRRDGHERFFQTELPIAAGAWVTLLTGQSTATHGVLDYIDRDARAYDGMAGRPASSTAYRDRTLQSILSQAGRRLASIYLPMTNPPWSVNGVMISGFPLADERRPPACPPGLTQALPPFSDRRLLTLRYDNPQRVDEYLTHNLRQIETVTSTYCLDPQYDVVMTCLPTPDLAHHYFWKPDDPAALDRIYGHYERVDATIGRLGATMRDDDIVVVCSDHGGRAAPGRLFGVNRWLMDAGFLVARTSSAVGRGAVGLTNRAVSWAKRQRLNQLLAKRITGRLRRRVSSMTQNTAFVDWSRSRAYGLDFFCPLAGVEVNLEGRQAHGIVKPSDYESLRQEMTLRLQALRDPDTGAPVFARVVAREVLFDGPHLDRFPDVIGILNDDYDVKTQLDRPVLGPNHGEPDYPYLGYHGHDAYFCARGPGIPAGVGPSTSTMRDLAPTLLMLAGVQPPAFMEGRPFEMMSSS